MVPTHSFGLASPRLAQASGVDGRHTHTLSPYQINQRANNDEILSQSGASRVLEIDFIQNKETNMTHTTLRVSQVGREVSAPSGSPGNWAWTQLKGELGTAVMMTGSTDQKPTGCQMGF